RGAVESRLSAVVADGMIGGRHRSNMELVAQGIANIASPLFGGIPATGAIARTATNVRNGGRTPIAGITHAVTLLLITLFFGRWAGLIPMATLAGILIVVAYSMSEWRTFLAEFRAPKSDVAVLLRCGGDVQGAFRAHRGAAQGADPQDAARPGDRLDRPACAPGPGAAQPS